MLSLCLSVALGLPILTACNPVYTHKSIPYNGAHSYPRLAIRQDNSSTTSPDGGQGPIYNLNNNTCDDFNTMSASEQWKAISGDQVLQTFNTMFQENQLICSECFGMSKGACTSNSADCQEGLRDVSKLNNTPRWDTAAAHFASDVDMSDLICSIQTGECGGAPSCKDCNGPGSYAILKSLETLSNSLKNTYGMSLSSYTILLILDQRNEVADA